MPSPRITSGWSRQYFGLQRSYSVRYIQGSHIDFAEENILFQMTPAYLSKGEAQELGLALKTARLPFMNKGPFPERQRIILGLISFPDVVGVSNPPALTKAIRKSNRPIPAEKKADIR